MRLSLRATVLAVASSLQLALTSKVPHRENCAARK